LITDHEVVQLDPVRPLGVVESLVDVLPTCPPARVRSLCVPKAHYDDASRDYGADDPLTEVSEQADGLRCLMRRPRRGSPALRRDPRRRRGPYPQQAAAAIDFIRGGQ
jgi:hypothetical protein